MVKRFTKFNNWYHLIILCFLIGSMVPEALAQSRKVTGKVTSTGDGLGIPGVNVLLQGGQTGTATDVNGEYSITVPDNNAVLVFSFIGFEPVNEVVGNRSVINVSLSEDASEMNEVVVTAL